MVKSIKEYLSYYTSYPDIDLLAMYSIRLKWHQRVYLKLKPMSLIFCRHKNVELSVRLIYRNGDNRSYVIHTVCKKCLKSIKCCYIDI